jgi:ribosomal protein L2
LGQHIVNTLGGARINTLGGVWVSVSIIRMTSCQHRHHQDESRSTSASLGCVRSNCVNSQPVAKASRSTYRMVVG